MTMMPPPIVTYRADGLDASSSSLSLLPEDDGMIDGTDDSFASGDDREGGWRRMTPNL